MNEPRCRVARHASRTLSAKLHAEPDDPPTEKEIKTMMRYWGTVAVSLVLFGCGGGGGGGESAVQKCEALMDLLCSRLQTCEEQLTGIAAPATFHEDCRDAQRTEVDCSRAVSVDPSYESCVGELGSVSCDIFLTLDANRNLESVNPPASCMAVINVP